LGGGLFSTAFWDAQDKRNSATLKQMTAVLNLAMGLPPVKGFGWHRKSKLDAALDVNPAKESLG
jgi:hypothetical protein